MNPRTQFAALVASAAAVVAAAVLVLSFMDGPGAEKRFEGGPATAVAPRPVLHADQPAGDPMPQAGAGPARFQPLAGAETEIRGRVISLGGAPIPGLKVVLAVPFADGGELPPPAALFTMAENYESHSWLGAVSSADGSFTLRTGRRGRAVLLAGTPSFAENAVTVELEGRPVEVDIRLASGLRVAGVVREKGTGLPVAGATVTATQQDAPAATRRKAVTLQDGRFEASGFGAGEVKLNVDPPAGSWVDAGWGRTAWARAGDENVDLYVFRAGIVSFKARSAPDMKPYNGVIRAQVMSDPDASAVVYAEGDGAYTLRGPSGAHQYSLWPQGFAPVPVTFNIEPETQVDAPRAVVLTPGSSLEGTVDLPVDPGGSVPRMAAVYVESLDPPLNRVLMREIPLEGRNSGGFVFENLPRGPHRVVAYANGFGMFRATVAVSGEKTALRVPLRRSDEGAARRGRPLAERRGLVLDIALPGLTNDEAVLLLAAVTDTALSITPSPGVASDLLRQDIRMGNARLMDAVRGVRNAWKLEFDEGTGVFSKR